jgi:hypothetical protein
VGVRRTELVFTIEMFFALGFFMLLGCLPAVSGMLVVSCLLNFAFTGFVLACARKEQIEISFQRKYFFTYPLRPRQVDIQFLDPLLI